MKKEGIYREILSAPKKQPLTQLWLSKKLKLSLSTVNNALTPLFALGALSKRARGFQIIDAKKILLYWASKRNLKKDILYSTRADAPVSDAEKSMPPRIVYTAYSAYKFRFGDVPADYSEIYVYSDDITEIKKRFPPRTGPPNLFVLRPDPRLFELAKENIAPMSQVFADLWNVKEWYAKEFVQALKRRIL